MLTEVDFRVADRDQQGSEDLECGGVVLRQKRIGPKAQVGVDLRGLGGTHAHGCFRECFNFFDVGVRRFRWDPARAVASCLVHQCVDEPSMQSFVEPREHLANEGP